MSPPVAGNPLEVPHPPHESVAARYTVTLGSQAFRLLLALVAAAIVPRALGPVAYGSYSFLLSTSAMLRGLLDNSTQQAFFTFSAQERTSGPLTKLYALVLGGQFAVVLLLIGGAAVAGKTDWLWHGQQLEQILWVTMLDWAMFLALSLQQLGDSKARTVYPQILGAMVSVAMLVGLLILEAADALVFYSFVWLNLGGASFTCVLLGYWLLARNRQVFWSGVVAVREAARRWWRFARPLLLLQYYLPLVAYFGLYLIQRWYGSAEQGYYGLALQWSALGMVFTNAGITIFWREIAHHTSSGAASRAAAAYQQFSGLFFFFVLALACWLSANSSVLVRLLGGDDYIRAGSVLAVMAFYPVVQTLGQLTMTSLKAMDRTAVYARWSALLSVPDLVLTYFLLAPRTAPLPGFELGALGMAIKTTLYGLIAVHVYDWLNCRFLGIDYVAALRRRLVTTAIVATITLVVLGLGGELLRRLGQTDAVELAAASCAYAVAVAAALWWRPSVAALNREQLMRGVLWLRRSRVGGR